MKKKEQMELILSDVLDELSFDCESNREKGVGITSEEYVLTQLQKLWDLIRDDYISDETLEELNRQKNNLNRKISSLKKANLKEKKCAICKKTTNDCAVMNETILLRAKKYKLISEDTEINESNNVNCCRDCFQKM